MVSIRRKLSRTRVWAIVLAVAAVPVATVFSLNTGTASAQAPPIKHVVVLYLENHSFDSILGYWCNAHPGRCPQGGMPASVHLSNGATVTPTVAPDVVPNVDHSVAAQVAAIDGGKMDGWWKVSGCAPSTHYACISGYTPAEIPNAASLATKFAVSDNTFSLKNSPSWGGHLYAVAASTDNFTGDNPVPLKGVTAGDGWGCNSDKVTPWSATVGGTTKNIPSCIPDFSLGLKNGGAFEPTPASHVPTIMDRLTTKGLSWRIYGQPTPSPSDGYIWDTCPTFADCLDTTQAKSNVLSSTFVTDAKAGKLAAFSLITPGGVDAKDSEHNGTSMTQGDDWVGQIASAIMNGPEWNSTVLFITWDDCGCFYDQMPPTPPQNPDMTPRGPRSPLIIVSPYAKPGYTDTGSTTFAGILAFVEKTFGLKALGANDAGAYDFSNAFNFAQTPLKPIHMVNRPMPKGDHLDLALDNEDS
jgi:phospholipase C